MATIKPFTGLCYNPDHIKDISKVIAPPYDTISSRERNWLSKQDPHNIVRLILPKDPPEIAHGDRYRMAASYLSTWRKESVLVEDPAPAIYVLDSSFTHDGEDYTRRCFVAAVKLEEFGSGTIFPHEETLPGPKADRLRLLESTKTNLSPIFALYNDTSNVLTMLNSAPTTDTGYTATDSDDVTTTVRAIVDPDAIAALCAAMEDTELLIADGHHRYETALNYRGPKETGGPQDYVMMACASSLDPGLLILPTHRVVDGGENFDENAFFGNAEKSFALSRVERTDAHPADVLLDTIEQFDRHAIGVYTKNGTMALLRPTDNELALKNPSPHSDAWKDLEVAFLHEFVLHQILGVGDEAARDGETVMYTRDASEAVEIVAEGQFSLALLVKPTRIDQMKKVAALHERMPPKSTYFYPKLPSGLILRGL